MFISVTKIERFLFCTCYTFQKPCEDVQPLNEKKLRARHDPVGVQRRHMKVVAKRVEACKHSKLIPPFFNIFSISKPMPFITDHVLKLNDFVSLHVLHSPNAH